MKLTAEIISDLESQILPRLDNIRILQAEVDAMQKTIAELRNIGVEKTQKQTEEISGEDNLHNYPGYPIDGSLLEKFRYLEDKTLRVWHKDEMDKLILHIEGEKAGADTLKSAPQKTHYYISKCELIRVKYYNKQKYTFYTTRSEWVEKQPNGTDIKFRLLPEHEPEPAQLIGLTEEQRQPGNISWDGIK